MSGLVFALVLFGVLVAIFNAVVVYALLYAHGEREKAAEVELA